MVNHLYGEPFPSVHITHMKGETVGNPPMAIGGFVSFDSS